MQVKDEHKHQREQREAVEKVDHKIDAIVNDVSLPCYSVRNDPKM